MKKPIIEFKNFTFQYFAQAEPTLYDINLTIYEGEKVLIVGPSGSGKSTLGHCINGLIPFSYKGKMEGSVTVSGLDTQTASLFELSKKVGTVLQDSDGQFVGLTVGEDIAFSLENDCVSQEEMKKTVQQVADIVDMGKLLKSSPYELSGGQKQRVAFAGVMVGDVQTLLFDEPLANLDPATGKTAIDLIDRIQKQYNKTVVIIEHRLEDVLYRHVDRIIVVSEGRIVADMNPDALIAAGILPKLGIREPLYATALKYAGVTITEEMGAGRMETLKLPQVRDQLIAWNAAQKDAPKKAEKPPILEVKGLHFQYNRKRKILKDINFTIREGEMVSIVGTNGAGKSTHVEDTSTLLMRMENGAQFVVQTNFNIPDEAAKWRVEFFGTKGRLLGDTMIGQNDMGKLNAVFIEKNVAYSATQNHADDAGIEIEGNFGNLYTREVESFCDSILNVKPLEVPASDAVHVQRIMEAAYRSGKEMRIFEI